jgi:poly-gamma-glutamate synthesis protein (capsule biosynthesis protein)
MLLLSLTLFLVPPLHAQWTAPEFPDPVWAEPEPQKTVKPLFQECTLLFVGDLMQHREQITRARQPDDTFVYEECFAEVKPYIEAADFAIGNLETTLGGKPYRGYPCFSAPDAWLETLKAVGFDIVTTSNNHCLDRGQYGLERTLMMADSLDMLTLGTYRDADDRAARYPLVVEKNGIRIAFLSYTYGINGFTVSEPNIVNTIDTVMMKEDLRQAYSRHPDVVIALMHWGTEYRLKPDSYQQFYARWLLNHGVDHIIGGHPHVIVPTERRPYSNRPDNHLIVWSQGNFISGMSAPHTFDGTMLTITLRKCGFVTRIVKDECHTVRTLRPDYRLKIID